MIKKKERLRLSEGERKHILQEISSLLKIQFNLKQTIQEQQQQFNAEVEELFLELIDFFDALEYLQNYMCDNLAYLEPDDDYLLKTIADIENRLLQILEKQEIQIIDFQDNYPDFRYCKVVDIEVRNDLENQTITRIVRRGFRLGDKILRPVEVVVSKREE
ncbi:nucleotide exchange factor GrpE [Calothrix sp. FACHB-1219]|uniref:nucleotide exchange factor GrpE n=1 Tax=unclassified Calothrix TaxID=2619626 RepID=UPI0016822185|nr:MULTISPECIES: nucleotide exchange factor GrpE [unclassified Calothrix]MBD2206131.1 nucleotide exchange factor GrpE [Calothrix sp. FACHB-168]MBD2220902.1 nucleotide exchange factor GrpE [Calothrix sp. FACHB-1219]